MQWWYSCVCLSVSAAAAAAAAERLVRPQSVTDVSSPCSSPPMKFMLATGAYWWHP